MEIPATGQKLPEVGDVIAGKYRIESVLGQGGMGAVFSAENQLTGKRVAIKWLLPEQAQGPSRERLLREARIACSVEHPNIVDIYDVGEHESGLFLVMEYLRGRPLADVLAREGRLDPEQLIGLLIPAMRGVHAAHQAGVIHRDLKPENIILSEIDGQIVPKVVDFGVSKTVGGSSVPISSLTRTGALVGTPHYMALEQVDGSNTIDPRTDVYAFGVIMYRSLTGQFPFDGTSLGEVILKIGTKDPLPLRTARPDLPPALEAAVLRAMARPRDRRFENLEEFARALEPFAPWVRFRESVDRSGRIHVDAEGRLISPHGGVVRNPLLDIRNTPPRIEGGVLGGVDMLSPRFDTPVIAQRDTPPVQSQRGGRTKAFWVGACLAGLVVLLASAWVVTQQGASAPVPHPTLPVALPAAAPVAQPEPTPTVEQLPIRDEQPAELVPLPEAEAEAPMAPAPEGPAIQLETISVDAPDEKTGHAAAKRRERKPTRADKPAQLIPGDRTKGLSSDDF